MTNSVIMNSVIRQLAESFINVYEPTLHQLAFKQRS